MPTKNKKYDAPNYSKMFAAPKPPRKGISTGDLNKYEKTFSQNMAKDSPNVKVTDAGYTKAVKSANAKTRKQVGYSSFEAASAAMSRSKVTKANTTVSGVAKRAYKKKAGK